MIMLVLFVEECVPCLFPMEASAVEAATSGSHVKRIVARPYFGPLTKLNVQQHLQQGLWVIQGIPQNHAKREYLPWDSTVQFGYLGGRKHGGRRNCGGKFNPTAVMFSTGTSQASGEDH